MIQKNIFEIAEGFGLTVEDVTVPENDGAFRILKGAHQVFTGKEEAVRNYLAAYERERPGLYEGSIYGYKE